jgi:glycosyltransferase involved in cell wall biosynthesis
MKKNDIKISVVMPLFNPRHDHLNECINSLLYQDFKDFELVVVDDSYKNIDNKRLFQSFPVDRIQYYRNEMPIGLTASLNLAIKNAKGAYIARMDGDDVCQKNRLSTQINFLEENPNISVVGSNCITIDSKSNAVGGRIYPHKKKDILNSFFNPLAHPSVMFQKNFFDKYGFYDLNTELEDWELWLRTLKMGGEISNIQKDLLKLRVFSDNDYQRPRHWHLVYKMGIKYFDKKRFTFSIIFIIFWFCVHITPFKNTLRKIKFS